MDEIDVFAGVADFCENFTPAVSKISDLKVQDNFELSDCDSDELFTTKKKKAGTRKERSKSKDKKKTVPKTNVTKASPKRRSTNKNAKDTTTENSVPEPLSPNNNGRRRSKRLNNAEVLVEKFMQSVPSISPTPITTNSQKGRARRKYISKKASKARVIGVVDLAGPKTPPLPPRSSTGKKTISLDSDEEFNLSLTGGLGVADTSLDLENEEINVKVKWGGEIIIIPQRRHQKFVDLLQSLAKKKSVEEKDIVLNLNDKIIRPEDTIETINYNIAQFISGRILNNFDHYMPLKKKDPNVLKVKIQSNAFKKPLEVRMKKDQNFKVLLIKCSEELQIPCESIKLSFDGEPLSWNKTPIDLELEGGEVIDCRIKN